VRDSVEMEWAGIPAVAVVHEALSGSADAMLMLSGMKDYPYVRVRFPIQPTALWSAAECDAVAEAILPEILDRLIAPDRASDPRRTTGPQPAGGSA